MLLTGAGPIGEPAPHVSQETDKTTAEESTRRLLPWARKVLKGEAK